MYNFTVIHDDLVPEYFNRQKELLVHLGEGKASISQQQINGLAPFISMQNPDGSP